MTRVQEYRRDLRALPVPAWPGYLTEHSGLPGPRGNIELAQAFADECDLTVVDALIATDDEYLVFCGVVGLGALLAAGGDDDGVDVARLHAHAGDERWRVREAVAMALQRVGDSRPDLWARVCTAWAGDDAPLVQRAALAGVCEPRLLRDPAAAALALDLCDRVTRSLAARPAEARRRPDVRTLRQALGYCWSVAVAADPEAGLPRFESWADSPDRDVAWVVRANRTKKRLARLL